MALQAINDVREISYDLHPHQLDRLGLKKAIESVIQKLSSASRLVLTAEVGEVDGLLPKTAEINVYRIIQEGLSNVIRHADAAEAVVQVKRDAAQIEILIQDNGKGFDTKAVETARHGFGLASIAERAKILSGKMGLKSNPGKGTTLVIQIPIKAAKS
jgi:signal transduction histidine kinase